MSCRSVFFPASLFLLSVTACGLPETNNLDTDDAAIDDDTGTLPTSSNDRHRDGTGEDEDDADATESQDEQPEEGQSTNTSDTEQPDEKPAEEPDQEDPALTDYSNADNPKCKGRIGVSADGNDHDEDDLGATPMTMAILWKAGCKIAHYDYNSHIWGDRNQSQYNKMVASTLGGADTFGFDKSRFFDDRKDKRGAIASIKMQVEMSTQDNHFYYIVGGPIAVPYEGIKAAKRGHAHVTVISHSNWNNDHGQKHHSGVSWAQLGKLVRTKKINDQNQGNRRGFGHRKTGLRPWNWLKDHPKLKFVYDRTAAAGSAKGDMSDAGMMFWHITGNERPSDADIKKYFGM